MSIHIAITFKFEQPINERTALDSTEIAANVLIVGTECDAFSDELVLGVRLTPAVDNGTDTTKLTAAVDDDEDDAMQPNGEMGPGRPVGSIDVNFPRADGCRMPLELAMVVTFGASEWLEIIFDELMWMGCILADSKDFLFESDESTLSNGNGTNVTDTSLIRSLSRYEK